VLPYSVSRKRTHPPPISRVSPLVTRLSRSVLRPNILKYYLRFLDCSRTIFPAQIQPFLQFSSTNSCRINTSKNISLFCISLISNHLKPTRINTSGNKDLKSPRINTSGSKDLKSCRINTSKKRGRGAVHKVRSAATNLPASPRDRGANIRRPLRRAGNRDGGRGLLVQAYVHVY
jgi:hypothetical protein